jgi:hypothetical protein
MLQTDAGKTAAVVPGEAAVQMVASHEVPDRPDATPAVPAAKIGK